MPNTTNFALPYPAATDPADVPADIQRLANAVDAALNPPILQMTTSGSQTLTNGTVTKPALVTTQAGSHGGTALTADAANNRIVVGQTAWYLISAVAGFDVAVSVQGRRLVMVYVGGVETLRVAPVTADSNIQLPVTGILRLGAATQLEMRVYQDSGVSVVLTGAALTVTQLAL